MERELINEEVMEEVVGGSIVFNADHTTCGRNRNDQYAVLNYDAVLQYIAANYKRMREKDMINNMINSGLLAIL